MFFLIVGHTHDKIDRLFSRLRIAITGHDFDTVEKLLEILRKRMQWFRFESSLILNCHLSRVCRECTPSISSGPGGHLRQMETLPHISDDWSRPVLIVPADDMARVASWRPTAVDMTTFNEKRHTPG